MRAVLDYLAEREDEFARHLSIARMLEMRVDVDIASPQDLHIEIRHINTLKSGLLIHLYNIVEAVTTRTLQEVGRAVVTDRPGLWTEKVLKEWVRAAVWSGEDRFGESALDHFTTISGVLVAGGSPDKFAVKGEPGSWDDNAIKKVAKRLGCSLNLSESIRHAAFEKVYRNETTALQYLKSRRNAIAHGAITFEEGAEGRTLNEIEQLANRVLPFLKAVTESYQKYLNNKLYLVNTEDAA